jgi:PEP-CTERM motif-containing protein
MKTIARASAALLMSLAIAAPADAAPIGIFSWDGDDFFGPTFSVENFADSGGSFFGVIVQLALADGTASALLLGDLAPGTSLQSTDDLFGLDIASADLRFAFELPGVVQVASLLAFGDSELVDYQPVAAPVPDPSTLLLVSIGAASVAWRSRRRGR